MFILAQHLYDEEGRQKGWRPPKQTFGVCIYVDMLLGMSRFCFRLHVHTKTHVQE